MLRQTLPNVPQDKGPERSAEHLLGHDYATLSHLP